MTALPALLTIDATAGHALDLVKGRLFTHFQHDWAFRYAISYTLLMISDAVSQLPPALTDHHPDVPWPNLAALAPLTVRDHYRPDPEILWEATKHLGALRQTVRLLISDYGHAQM